eukprot:scaffold131201_cov15-Tisochrysis_lutea.AAC.1
MSCEACTDQEQRSKCKACRAWSSCPHHGAARHVVHTRGQARVVEKREVRPQADMRLRDVPGVAIRLRM